MKATTAGPASPVKASVRSRVSTKRKSSVMARSSALECQNKYVVRLESGHDSSCFVRRSSNILCESVLTKVSSNTTRKDKVSSNITMNSSTHKTLHRMPTKTVTVPNKTQEKPKAFLKRYDSLSAKDPATAAELTHVFLHPRNLSEHYYVGQELGQGSFGNVRLAKDKVLYSTCLYSLLRCPFSPVCELELRLRSIFLTCVDDVMAESFERMRYGVLCALWQNGSPLC
mmetsp:Transcript_8797/g.16586  ORF Transcript_8797/g.16586 Transcript_8797/m.16586 type:complete len:228 (+) Transcript_8797:378-1061(+)